ncbi:hypothetical protein [Anabaena sp. CCY 9910]
MLPISPEKNRSPYRALFAELAPTDPLAVVAGVEFSIAAPKDSA